MEACYGSVHVTVKTRHLLLPDTSIEKIIMLDHVDATELKKDLNILRGVDTNQYLEIGGQVI